MCIRDRGKGGDRPDSTGMADLLAVGGIANPGAVLDGAPGEPVGLDPALAASGGTGGVHWPPSFPTSVLQQDWNDLVITNVFTCSSDQVGATGGGGAYALDGDTGIAVSPLLPGLNPPTPATPDTPGGQGAALGLGPLERTLNPELGFLRGGSGGGGGGTGLIRTRTNGLPLNCGQPIPPGGSLVITSYATHSGAGGGGAGGGLQLNAGSELRVDGTVRCAGGAGGRSMGLIVPGQFVTDNLAAPGGGASGGAALLQAPQLQIAGLPGRIDVRGGDGGTQNSELYSTGGDGSPGLVRLESFPAPDPAAEAPKIEPFDPGAPTSDAVLSAGELTVATQGEAAFSGAQSCWIQPDGNFFELVFAADDLTDPANPVLGWDVDLVLNAPGLPAFPFRGDNGLLSFSIEDLLGSDLKGPNPSPLVVRFQGVRILKAEDGLCAVDLSPGSPAVVPDSLTGWVRHPSELNGYWDFLGPAAAAARRPNAVRFQVVFDNRTGLYPGLVLGLTNFRVTAQPD